MKKPHKPKNPKSDKKSKAKKKKYKVRNWKEYNEMLVKRGEIIFHITKQAMEEWEKTKKTGKRGPPRKFSDTAIETALTIQQYFRLPLRAAEGVVRGMLEALGASCGAPDYSTLCKRGKTLEIDIRVRSIAHTGPLHLLVDSSGVKVYGEGEWKVRQHGVSKRRTWKKLHLGSDGDTGDIVAAVMTDNDMHDGEVFPDILKEIPDDLIADVGGDGGYDTRECYDAIRKRGALPLIPPRKGARIWAHGNSRRERLPRDETVRRIRQVGRKRWKIESGYHRRSRIENTFFRFKTVFGDRLAARTRENQCAQLRVRSKLLNRFTLLGMPGSYVAA